jgi:predicted nucleic acid-binding protein
MNPIIVDSNVLLDVMTDDPDWADRSRTAVARLSSHRQLVINPIIFAEVSVSFDRIEDVETQLPTDVFRREDLPYEAAFLAGKAHVVYRKRGGARRSPLPDFFIGAHAAVRGYDVLTRDPEGYRSYFPSVTLLSPGVSAP